MLNGYRERLLRRSHIRGLHGPDHIGRQRHAAIVLVVTGFARAACWAALIVLYLFGVPFTHTLFASVTFVALVSLYANGATDFGQACASLAQLTAGDAHHDVEHVRASLDVDFRQIDLDVARLAAMQGPEAEELAARIRERLGVS
jgi:hypothetical protein